MWILPLFAAELLITLSKPRWRFIFRSLLIVPLAFPGVVQVLVWEFLYDPNDGVINHFLHAVGQFGPPGRVQGQVLVRPPGPHAQDVAWPQRGALSSQHGGEVLRPDRHPGERVVAARPRGRARRWDPGASARDMKK